jgi:hypothetical protein
MYPFQFGLFRLTGGSRNTIGRSGTSFNVSSNDLEYRQLAIIGQQILTINLEQSSYASNVTKNGALSAFGVISSTKR